MSAQIYTQSALELTGWFLNRGYPSNLIKETTSDLTFRDTQKYLEQKDNKTLEECTTLLRVRQHPAISSAAIYRALEDKDLPFKNIVVRPRPSTIGELITRASSSGVRSDYVLRSTSSNKDSAEKPPTDKEQVSTTNNKDQKVS